VLFSESKSMIFPVTIAPSHSLTYLSLSLDFSAISLVDYGGRANIRSNNLAL
jgi:hypothetical protein